MLIPSMKIQSKSDSNLCPITILLHILIDGNQKTNNFQCIADRSMLLKGSITFVPFHPLFFTIGSNWTKIILESWQSKTPNFYLGS